MLKKFLIGTVVALALLVGVTASAADYGTVTLKVGSKGPAVSALQTLVGATADGAFGPLTKAKVMVWQQSNGLAADGLFGNMSKAKANSSTTTTTTTTTTTGSTTLKGAEGSITSVDDSTSGTETTLGEGKSEKVLGMKVTADDGSDLAINTIKVQIDTADLGADHIGSTRLERVIDGVDIYMGTTKVGSADVADFSKNGTKYTKSVSLSNAVIRAGEYAKFYVMVNAAPTVDSENTDNKPVLSIDSIRYTDAMGVVSTLGSLDLTDVTPVTFGFESSTQNDSITTVSASSNPEVTTLKVKDDGTSDEYLVFSFKLKADADSSDLNVLTIPITATTETGADKVINDIYLKVGSTVYDNYDLITGDIYKFTIDEGDLTIAGGDTAEVKVYASFNEEGLSSTYTSPEVVKFSMAGTTLVVENVDGDSVSTSSVTPRSGNEMTLSTSSTLITGVTTDSNSDTNSKVGTFTFKFTVEADGAAVTLNAAAFDKDVIGGTDTSTFSIVKTSGTATTNTAGVEYVVEDGNTASFTATYTIEAAAAGTFYVQLNTIDGISVDKTAGPEALVA